MPPPEQPSYGKFLYQVNEQTFGPVALPELAAELKYGNIAPDTLVRREYETEWTPFQSREEFAEAQDMSVEAIAHYLEVRNRSLNPKAQHHSPWPAPGLTMIVAGVFLAIIAFSYLLSDTGKKPADDSSPSDTPVPVTLSWSTTSRDGFTIESPVQLDLQPKSEPEFTCYRGKTDDADFGIDLIDYPASSSTNYPAAKISELLSRFMDTLTAGESLDVDITVNETHGRDILFTYGQWHRFPGGLRILAGSGKIGMAWVTARTKKFSSEDIDRFTKSFQLDR